MTITLKVNGKQHGGWKSASVSRGIESPTSAFNLTVSERWPGQNVPVSIHPGDKCQVLVNRQPIVTGYVDEVAASYEGQSHEVTFKGRSKTADLVDCSVVHAGPIQGQTIDKIVAELANPFGITVVTETDLGDAINENINQGETVWDVIEKLALIRGLLVCDNEAGQIVITRAGTGRSTGAIINADGQTNVLSGSGTFNTADRFSLYVVKGQAQGDDFSFGEDVAASEAQEKDSNISRYRPYVMVAEKAADTGHCRDRARWERATRAGKSVRLQYTVMGWTQDGSSLWLPNQLVTVRDDFLKVSGQFLIADVSYDISESGETTRLVCVPPETYSSMPTLPAASKTTAFWEKIEPS